MAGEALDDGHGVGLSVTVAGTRSPVEAPRRSGAALTWYGPFLFGIFLLVLWDGAIRAFDVPSYLLPSPMDVVDVFSERAGRLWNDTLITGLEITLSLPLSLAVGIAGGVATVAWAPFRRSMYPLLVAMQAMPTVAAAPLLIVWFGYGTLSKVLLATLISYFAILVGTITGLQSVGADEVRLGRTIGLSRLRLFLKIELPSALPSILGGVKVASTLSVVGAVVGEFVGSTGGLGNFILQAQGLADPAGLFAAVAILVALGVGIYGAVSLAQRWLVPWSSGDAGRA